MESIERYFGEKKAMGNGVFEVAKDVLDLSPVAVCWQMHVLTSLIDCKGNVGLRKCKVLECTYNATIECGILEWFTIPQG